MGKKIEFTQKLADEICFAIANGSEGLRRHCKKNPHWPSHSQIMDWRSEIASFRDQYTLAKQKQVEYLVDEIVTISDDTSNDTIVNDEGKLTCNKEWIARSRLRVDTRKWIACKLAPKIYGDKLEVKSEQSLSKDTIENIREARKEFKKDC